MKKKLKSLSKRIATVISLICLILTVLIVPAHAEDVDDLSGSNNYISTMEQDLRPNIYPETGNNYVMQFDLNSINEAHGPYPSLYLDITLKVWGHIIEGDPDSMLTCYIQAYGDYIISVGYTGDGVSSYKYYDATTDNFMWIEFNQLISVSENISPAPYDIWQFVQFFNKMQYDKAITAKQNAYTEGFDAGANASYQDGYNKGYGDGYDAGHTVSYDDGYRAGYNVGNVDGYDLGYTNGSNEGYQTGFTAGNTAGYNSGYSVGEQTGYQTGYTAGNDVGYQTGYQAGLQTADIGTLPQAITTAIETPVNVFKDMTNFTILGINIFDAVLAILTLAVVIAILKHTIK